MIDEVLGGRIPKWFHAHAEGTLQDAWAHGDNEEFVAAKAKKMRVLLVTQTCDLVQRSIYQVAPVFPAAPLSPADKDNLRTNEILYMFYLPASPPDLSEDSYADLSQIAHVPKTYFKPEAVRARLSEATRRCLQAQVAEFYGRPFGFNIRDRSPHTAEFACVRCFYEHFFLQKKPVTKGENFPECERCGDGLWVRISDAVQTDLNFAKPGDGQQQASSPPSVVTMPKRE